jgi:hypothetical protein
MVLAANMVLAARARAEGPNLHQLFICISCR